MGMWKMSILMRFCSKKIFFLRSKLFCVMCLRGVLVGYARVTRILCNSKSFLHRHFVWLHFVGIKPKFIGHPAILQSHLNLLDMTIPNDNSKNSAFIYKILKIPNFSSLSILIAMLNSYIHKNQNQKKIYNQWRSEKEIWSIRLCNRA